MPYRVARMYLPHAPPSPRSPLRRERLSAEKKLPLPYHGSLTPFPRRVEGCDYQSRPVRHLAQRRAPLRGRFLSLRPSPVQLYRRILSWVFSLFEIVRLCCFDRNPSLSSDYRPLTSVFAW